MLGTDRLDRLFSDVTKVTPHRNNNVNYVERKHLPHLSNSTEDTWFFKFFCHRNNKWWANFCWLQLIIYLFFSEKKLRIFGKKIYGWNFQLLHDFFYNFSQFTPLPIMVITVVFCILNSKEKRSYVELKKSPNDKCIAMGLL